MKYSRSPPLATENLLENTDGVHRPHHRSLGAAACYLLFMLTRAILMPSLFHRQKTFDDHFLSDDPYATTPAVKDVLRWLYQDCT